MKREIILAIETAIGGGSLSLLENNTEIDFWIGESERLRAGNLLSIVAKMFAKNNLQKSDINKIIYSEGPGSHTGIRIGTATAKGLQTAFDCVCIGQSVLKALTLQTNVKGVVQTAIRTSQNRVWRQIFEKCVGNIIKVKTLAELVSNEAFLSENSENNNFQESILLESNDKIFDEKMIISVRSETNIARLIGMTANYNFTSWRNFE